MLFCVGIFVRSWGETVLDERRWTWYHSGQGRLPRGLDGKVGQQVDVKWPLLARTGGGYFFIWVPREIAAITSISSAIVSVTLIGANAVVIEGCRIGHDAVVAAGAIVVGDVAPNTVVAGCPARVIKQKDEKTAGKTALVDALRAL